MVYTDQELDEIRKEWDNLKEVIAKEFYIYEILNWLEEKLDDMI